MKLNLLHLFGVVLILYTHLTEAAPNRFVETSGDHGYTIAVERECSEMLSTAPWVHPFYNESRICRDANAAAGVMMMLLFGVMSPDSASYTFGVGRSSEALFDFNCTGRSLVGVEVTEIGEVTSFLEYFPATTLTQQFATNTSFYLKPLAFLTNKQNMGAAGIVYEKSRVKFASGHVPKPREDVMVVFNSLPEILGNGRQDYYDFVTRYGLFYPTELTLGGYITKLYSGNAPNAAAYDSDDKLFNFVSDLSPWVDTHLMKRGSQITNRGLEAWKQNVSPIVISHRLAPLHKAFEASEDVIRTANLEKVVKSKIGIERMKRVTLFLDTQPDKSRLLSFVLEFIKSEILRACPETNMIPYIEKYMIKNNNINGTKFHVNFTRADNAVQMVYLIPNICANFGQDISVGSRGVKKSLPEDLDCLVLYRNRNCGGVSWLVWTETQLLANLPEASSIRICNEREGAQINAG